MSMSQVGVVTKTEDKPVVQYILNEDSLVELGLPAFVDAVDHPRLGAGAVRTSRVIKVGQEGVFETYNTVYKPVQQLNG